MRATFVKAIDTIENEELRKFAHFCVGNIPAYFGKFRQAAPVNITP